MRWPALLAGTGYGTALAVHALTKSTPPDTTTPAAIGSGNTNFNRALPTEGPAATPRINSDPDSDFMLTVSSRERDGESDYVDSRENLPTSLANILELEVHIQELQQMHEDNRLYLEDINQPIELFTQINKIDPTELSDYEFNRLKTTVTMVLHYCIAPNHHSRTHP